MGCVTFVAPAGWQATPLEQALVRGWILSAPDGSGTQFRIWGARTGLASPRKAMESTVSRWEAEGSHPRLDDLLVDGVPALLLQSEVLQDGEDLETRRNMLVLLHDGVEYTAAAVYELPAKAPDPLAPLAAAFLHSVRVKCE